MANGKHLVICALVVVFRVGLRKPMERHARALSLSLSENARERCLTTTFAGHARKNKKATAEERGWKIQMHVASTVGLLQV